MQLSDGNGKEILTARTKANIATSRAQSPEAQSAPDVASFSATHEAKARARARALHSEHVSLSRGQEISTDVPFGVHVRMKKTAVAALRTGSGQHRTRTGERTRVARRFRGQTGAVTGETGSHKHKTHEHTYEGVGQCTSATRTWT